MKTNIICWILFLNVISVSAQQKITVYFDFDQDVLNDNAVQLLDTWSLIGNVEVTKIYGFCDWKGTNSYNDSLSMRRVKTIYNFLKEKNIKVRDNYEVRGFGEDFEQSKKQSENRKVLIMYEIKKDTVIPESPLQKKIRNSKTGDKITLENINFFNMSPRVLAKSKPVLYDLLCAMQDNPNLKIEIQGHVCCQTTEQNTALSVSRARAIYNYLISQKINRKRLSYKGFGTTMPIHPIPEKNEVEEFENRRVEIMIVAN